MSTQPRTSAVTTAPGPPVAIANPFHVDLVIPYSIALGSWDRGIAQKYIKEGYEDLLRALEGEGGLKVATKSGRGVKGKEEVWVFVGATEEKIDELVERERQLDQSHNLPPHSHPIPPSSSTRIRLLYNLLTSPALQQGLGITPKEGKWIRVQSIAALHDEAADKAWVEKWTLGGDWRVGLFTGISDKAGEGLGSHQPPPVHLYFEFLNTYTQSLLPLSVVSTLFYFLTPADSYPPLYALVLSLYSTIFVSYWRVKERKLAVKWGYRGCESVTVGKLRPEYVASNNLEKRGDVVGVVHAGDHVQRDAKVLFSVPVIAICGILLGTVLMGIFLLEAFVAQAYEGIGHQVLPFLPTALFVLVVPQIVAAYNSLAKMLVTWENHPTPAGAEKSLTAKTFAMNGIVAYLGLFLSAYVYVPFGPYIMHTVQTQLANYQQSLGQLGEKLRFAPTPEKAGLGPKTSVVTQRAFKADRLKGQLFAYTVTNQVVNTFLELGLPFILRFVGDWRAGKTTIKEAVHGDFGDEKPLKSAADVEKHFLDKVEKELALPEYSLFTDYAETCTQFGYVTVWSIVWPLAPVFAFINNYLELRTDAVKICKHVRRPIGDRVESIGSWLDTLGIISWIGAITNATLIYLFRPTISPDQSPNPNLTTTPGSSPHLTNILSSYDVSSTWKMILPTLIPLAAVALTASHGFIVLRWFVAEVVERLFWRGSQEEKEVQRLEDRGGGENKGVEKRSLGGGRSDLRGGFWNGGEEGAREIGRALKAE